MAVCPGRHDRCPAFDTGSTGLFATPALSRDGATLFVKPYDSAMFAVNATTGAQKWSFVAGTGRNDGHTWVSSPVVSPDGMTVYMGSFDDQVYAFDSTTGENKWEFSTGVEKKWEFSTAGDVRSSPVLSTDGATLFVGSDDNRVYALDTGITLPATSTSTPSPMSCEGPVPSL